MSAATRAGPRSAPIGCSQEGDGVRNLRPGAVLRPLAQRIDTEYSPAFRVKDWIRFQYTDGLGPGDAPMRIVVPSDG